MQEIIQIISSSLELGLIYSLVSLGVYLTFKILNYPDLTVDGSLVTGAAVAAVSIQAGLPVYVTIVLSFVSGCLVGLMTGLIHVKFGVGKILSGVITLSLLYTINLRIMNAPNLSLINAENIIPFFQYGTPILYKLLFLIIFVGIIKLLIDWFLLTQYGLRLRAVGENESTAKSLSINVGKAKYIILALSNGLVALSGCLLAQDTGFADVNMGIGTIILGIAGLMLGLTFIKTNKIHIVTSAIILGTIFYQVIVNVALRLGLPATDLKFIMGIIVLVTLSLSYKKFYE